MNRSFFLLLTISMHMNYTMESIPQPVDEPTNAQPSTPSAQHCPQNSYPPRLCPGCYKQKNISALTKLRFLQRKAQSALD